MKKLNRNGGQFPLFCQNSSWVMVNNISNHNNMNPHCVKQQTAMAISLTESNNMNHTMMVDNLTNPTIWTTLLLKYKQQWQKN